MPTILSPLKMIPALKTTDSEDEQHATAAAIDKLVKLDEQQRHRFAHAGVQRELHTSPVSTNAHRLQKKQSLTSICDCRLLDAAKRTHSSQVKMAVSDKVCCGELRNKITPQRMHPATFSCPIMFSPYFLLHLWASAIFWARDADDDEL